MHVGYTVPGRGDGQADRPRRLGGPQRGHGPGHGLLHRRGGPSTSTSTCRRPRSPSRASAMPARSRARLIGEEGSTVVAVSDSTGGIHDPRRPRHRQGHGLEGGARHRPGLPGRKRHHQRRAPRGRLRHPDPGRPREPDHRAQRRPDQGQARGRGGQRPDHPRGRRDPVRQRGLPDPRHPVQRRRRDRQLLRVGPGPEPRLLGRDRGQPASSRGSWPRRSRTPGDEPDARTSTCGRRPTCWPSSASPTPPPCAASTRNRAPVRRRPPAPEPGRPLAGSPGTGAVRCYHRRHARPRREVPVQGGDPPPGELRRRAGHPRQRRGPADRRDHQPALRLRGVHPRAEPPGHARPAGRHDPGRAADRGARRSSRKSPTSTSRRRSTSASSPGAPGSGWRSTTP